MSPQAIEAISGAVVVLLTAIASWFARPPVERALHRRKVRKQIEAKTDDPVAPPDVK
jgi:hypothetical protein